MFFKSSIDRLLSPLNTFSQRLPRGRKAKVKRPRRQRRWCEALEDRRVMSAGALDPTFGSGGTASPVSNINGGAAAIAVDSGAQSPTVGDVVVAGNANLSNGSIDFAVARYTPNGTPDASFGKNGEVITAFKSYAYDYAYGVGVQSDGKIVAAGVVQGKSDSFALARYSVNGSLDTAFGLGGEVVTPSFTGSGTTASNDYARAEQIQTDGKIVVVGETNNGGDNAIALARYTSNGKLDSAFGSGGKVMTPHTAIPGSLFNSQSGATQVEGAALQADGKILVSGSTEVTGGRYPTCEVFVARYNTDGTLDASFGTGGVVTLPPVQAAVGGGPGYVAVEPGGEIVVTGFVGQLALLHSGQAGYADGSFDTTFGGNNTGIASQGFGPIALEPSGDIVLGQPNWVGGSLITRFLPNGTPDSTFGSAGTVTLAASSFAALVNQPDGKIDVAFNSQIVKGTSTAIGFVVDRLLPGEPQIGSLTSTTNLDGSLTLTASNTIDDNPNATITKVGFYYFDSNGNKVSLGNGVSDGQGGWTLTLSLPPGTYTIYAQAVDSYGVTGDPLGISETLS